MSEFLDGLARALATPMPRSRAVRILAGAIVFGGVPGVRVTGSAAGVSRRRAVGCYNEHSPSFCRDTAGQPFHKGPICGPPNMNPLTPDCCDPGEFCCTELAPDYYCCGEGCDCYKGLCCPPGSERGVDSSGRPGCCPLGWSWCDGKCCQKPDAWCVNGECEECPRARQCGSVCCEPDEECVNRRCEPKCPPQRQCAEECCKPNEECVTLRTRTQGVRSRCLPKCPSGRVRCGASSCCREGERCVDPARGTCGRCRRDQVPCGEGHCCVRGGTCCDPQSGLCCNPDENCNSWGPRQSRRHGCCKEGLRPCQSRPGADPVCCRHPDERCLPILTYAAGGVTAKAARTCCEPQRQVNGRNEPVACCPPGYVSLGDQMTVAAGLNGLCCNQLKLCGTINNRSCCQNHQVCCKGACCNGRECCGQGCCPADKLCCNNECVDEDEANCGVCGKKCGPGTICREGACILL